MKWKRHDFSDPRPMPVQPSAKGHLALFMKGEPQALPRANCRPNGSLAATQGDATAQFLLASLFEAGPGDIRKDDKEAARFYRLAADQSVPEAQVRLGNFYEQGRGGLAKNETEAARLYRLAADKGNQDAQFSLGVFVEHGRAGIAPNLQEAAQLYKLAAEEPPPQTSGASTGARCAAGAFSPPADTRALVQSRRQSLPLGTAASGSPRTRCRSPSSRLSSAKTRAGPGRASGCTIMRMMSRGHDHDCSADGAVSGVIAAFPRILSRTHRRRALPPPERGGLGGGQRFAVLAAALPPRPSPFQGEGEAGRGRFLSKHAAR